jgi:hypothetical protein
VESPGRCKSLSLVAVLAFASVEGSGHGRDGDSPAELFEPPLELGGRVGSSQLFDGEALTLLLDLARLQQIIADSVEVIGSDAHLLRGL